MKSINIKKSKFRREITGLIKKIQSGKLDKISIYENGTRVAVLVSIDCMSNPLENSLHELKEKFV